MIVEFTLLGDNLFSTLNGGPYFKHSCAASWMILCANQEELDNYYNQLSAVPEAEMCGWITDKFGVSWQLIPANFTEYMNTDDASKKSNLMKAIMEMKRLSFAEIDKAYND
jgi:predicted 3-demethylubiquinone-9 3-methyltransferase (glyoxalase superfamily)